MAIFKNKQEPKPSDNVTPEKLRDFAYEPFVTSDHKLVEKLQDKFTIKNISLNKDAETRTFTFNATRLEVEAYLGGK